MFRRFSFQVILRIALLFATLLGMALIFGNEDLFFNQLILGTVIILQIYDLLAYVKKTNRELQKFLDAIKHNDYTVNFTSKKLGDTFNGLDASFSSIIESYKQVKIEKEAQFQFLDAIVGRLNVGIISIKNEEQIVLMNEAAATLLQVPILKKWGHLAQKKPAFAKLVDSLPKGGKRLLEIKSRKATNQLSVNISPLYLLDEPYVVITLQDINTEIEQKEGEAWNKLIRILTHEIMNSLTPVASLTETMLMLMQDSEGKVKAAHILGNESLEDIHFSLQTILRRSEGMLHFVEDYRKLTRIPTPELQEVGVKILLDEIKKLYEAELSKKGIQLQVKVEEGKRTILADRKLIEQVLINLISNASHALKGQDSPNIKLTAMSRENEVLLIVSDNGCGIPEERLSKIFIPFYSTKESGSGIGLSLSRNIMNLHNGTLQVSSTLNQGTSFSLVFR